MGVATFVSLPSLATALEKVPPLCTVEFRHDSLRHIDHACLNLLESWKKQHEGNGGKVIVDWEKLKGRSYQTRKTQRPKRPVSLL
jgi:MFS superfamily sulfate permease-like transporter